MAPDPTVLHHRDEVGALLAALANADTIGERKTLAAEIRARVGEDDLDVSALLDEIERQKN